MPPVMGAAAFIMAEMTGITYNQIIIYAALPAILFYVSILFMVDFTAAKQGLTGLPKKELPSLAKSFKESIFVLIGPLVIVIFLLMGVSAIKAAFYAVLVVILGSYFKKETRLTWSRFIEALELAAKNSLGLIAACATAGIIVGTVTLTGIGNKFADLIGMFSGDSIMLALLLTMVACIILGMGLPTTALYIVLAAVAAPGLVNLGIPTPAVHLFIFYFGCMSAVTPPVALTSFVAAGLAGGNAMKTAMEGLKLSLAAFLLPFLFALNPVLIAYETTVLEFLLVATTALFGIAAFAASLVGYALAKLNAIERILLLGSALGLMIPGLLSDLLGITIMLLILIKNYATMKKEKTDSIPAIAKEG